MDDLNEALKKLYGSQSLPERRSAEILRACEPAREIYRWKRLSAISIGVAALSLLTAILSAVFIRPAAPEIAVKDLSQAPEMAVVAAPEVERSAPTKPTTPPDKSIRFDPSGGSRFEPEAGHQLVAVRVFAEHCQASKRISAVFDDLRDQFSGDDVLFVSFDRGRASGRDQAALLAEALGLKPAGKTYKRTGRIVIVSPDGAVQAVVDSTTDPGEASEILSSHLAMASR